MKVRFSQKLNTRLLIYPLLLLLSVFLAGGIAFYYLSPLHYLKDFYRLHLVSLSSEKKLAVDAWFEQYKKHMGYLSRNQTIRDNLVILVTPPMNSQKRDRKVIDVISREVQQKVSQLLGDMALSSNSRMIALLSTDGRVVASSSKEYLGEDWSDRAAIKNMLSESNPGAVVGFSGDGNADAGIINIAPVSGSDDEIKAYIYSVANIDKLAGLLRRESSFYKTEKVELIDREGNLVVTRSGIPAKRLKYNIPKGYAENSVMLRDDLFFHIVGLDNAPFRLISIVDRQEVMRPFLMLVAVFASFAGLMLLVLMFQSAYLAPRLITRPLAKLASAAKSVASGNFDADWGKGHAGEMLELKNACEEMAAEWRARELRLRGEAGPENRKPGGTRAVAEEFDVTGLLQEVEEKARGLIGTKEIELVVDCSDALRAHPAYTDRLRLKRILDSLIDHAVSSTEAGTVTVLLSEAVQDGIRYMEASVADTGSGIGPEHLERLFEESAGYPGLAEAKKLAEGLGGAMEVESEQDKGSAITVSIPVKALLY